MGNSVFIRVGSYSDRVKKVLKFMRPKQEEALTEAARLLHEAGWPFYDVGLAVEVVMAENISTDEGYQSSVRRPREILEEEATRIGFLEDLGS